VIFCSDPVPITGNIRRLDPSFTTLVSSSAMRTEMPALPSVSSTTTPWLVPASGCAVAACEGAAVVVRDRDKAMAAAGMIKHFMADNPYPVRTCSASALDYGLIYRGSLLDIDSRIPSARGEEFLDRIEPRDENRVKWKVQRGWRDSQANRPPFVGRLLVGLWLA
jgi:hypothetical protein